jgi:hypothetical protein
MRVASQDSPETTSWLRSLQSVTECTVLHSGCEHPAVHKSARCAELALLCERPCRGCEVTYPSHLDGEYPGTSSYSEKKIEGCFRISYSMPRQAFAVKQQMINHVSQHLSRLMNPRPARAAGCGSGMSTPARRVPRFHHLDPRLSHMAKATPDAASTMHAHMARTATLRAVRRSSEYSRRYEWKHRTLVPKHGNAMAQHAATMLLGHWVSTFRPG